jgi:diguanylate cyclase (GGDEF)-like protein/PAS domain S-box-containing protein
MENKYNKLIDFMDLLLDVVCVVNPEGRLLFASAASKQIFGYTPDELVGTPVIDLVHPEDKERTLAVSTRVNAGEEIVGFENRYLHKDGSIVHVRWTARWSEKEQIRIAVAHDISERVRAEALQRALYAISEASHQAEDLNSLFPLIHRIIGELLPAKNFFVALYDRRKDELSFPYYVDEFDSTPNPRPLDSGTLSAEVIRTGQALLLTPNSNKAMHLKHAKVVGTDSLDWLGVPLHSGKRTFGALVVQSYAGKTLYTDQDQELLQFVSNQVASAIIRTRLHERLTHAAGHDALTGLANRGLFQDRLQRVIARVRRIPGRFALLYLDLDKFKVINDLYGHTVGDKMLVEVARRLQGCIRESDTVARFGGDEFVLLLTNIVNPIDAKNVAMKIRQALNKPIKLGEHSLLIAPSIGIAVYPEDGDSSEALLHFADDAMYQSKRTAI